MTEMPPPAPPPDIPTEGAPANKLLMMEIVRLKFNLGYQHLLQNLYHGLSDKQLALISADTPEKILHFHAEWKAATIILNFLKNEPDNVAAAYQEVFNMTPQEDVLVN